MSNSTPLPTSLFDLAYIVPATGAWLVHGGLSYDEMIMLGKTLNSLSRPFRVKCRDSEDLWSIQNDEEMLLLLNLFSSRINDRYGRITDDK